MLIRSVGERADDGDVVEDTRTRYKEEEETLGVWHACFLAARTCLRFMSHLHLLVLVVLVQYTNTDRLSTYKLRQDNDTGSAKLILVGFSDQQARNNYCYAGFNWLSTQKVLFMVIR